MQDDRGPGSYDLGFAVSMRKVKLRQISQDEIFPRKGLLERMAELPLRTCDQDPHNLIGVTGIQG